MRYVILLVTDGVQPAVSADMREQPMPNVCSVRKHCFVDARAGRRTSPAGG